MEHQPMRRTTTHLESFHISGVELRLYRPFIRALAMVKLAAARANAESGRLPVEMLQGIEGACQELIEGKLHEEFRVDVFQDGAGAATDTNANEVIANRALELMGHAKGEYAFCDPHEDVNRSQSAGEAYPTALHLGMALGNQELSAEVTRLIAALRAKGGEFAGTATPPQELQDLAQALTEEVRALLALAGGLREADRGGRPIEAGEGSPPGFPERWERHLRRIAGIPVHLGDRAEAARDTQAFVAQSSCMKSVAIRLSDVGYCLRWLSTDPGGACTVIRDVVDMVCFRVIGGDLTVALAVEAGQRQGDLFGPVIAACIFEAQTTLLNATRMLRVHGVEGDSMASPDPGIGRDRAGELALEMMRTGRGIVALLRRKEVLRQELIAQGRGPEGTTARKRSARTRT